MSRLIALFLVNFGLRFPSFLTPFTSDDEAAYAAMAQILLKGGSIYRDAVDHKPPMTVWLYSGVFSLFGEYNMLAIHVGLILWVFATAYVLGKIAEHFGGANSRWGAMLFYILFSTTLRDYDALAANNELLMNLPIALGVLLLLRRRFLPSGILFALAVTIKYQSIFPTLCFVLYSVWRRRWREVCLLTLGGSLVAGLVVGVSFLQGSWPDLLFWGILYNLNYVGQGLEGMEVVLRFLRRSLETILPAAIVWLLGFKTIFTKAHPLLVLWFVSSILAMLPGGRFFGHYFLQPLAPLAVLAALAMPRLWEVANRRRRYLILASLVIPVALFTTLNFRRTQMLRIVGEIEPDYAAVGQRVGQLTTPDERIFVWMNSPQIYYYAKRTPATRFTFCNYQSGQSPATPTEEDMGVDTLRHQSKESWDLLMQDLAEKRPTIFVDATHAHFDDFGKSPIEKFPRLTAWLSDHYVLQEEVKGVRLFRLKGAEK